MRQRRRPGELNGAASETRLRSERSSPPAEPVGSSDVEVIELGPIPPSTAADRAKVAFVGGIVILAGLILAAGPRPAVSELPDDPTAPSSTRPLLADSSTTPTRFPWAWTADELRGYGRGATVTNLWTLGDRFVAEIESDEGADGGPYGPVSSVLLMSTDAVTWTDLARPAADFVVEAGTVVAGRLVLLGWTGDADSAAWQLWSTDGATWRQVSRPQGLIPRPEGEIHLAYSDACLSEGSCGGRGWVATFAIAEPLVDDAVYVSRDGRAWTTAPFLFEPPASIMGVVAHHGVWFVLGRQRDFGQGVGRATRTGVATSADLTSWTWTEIADLAGSSGGDAIASAGDALSASGAGVDGLAVVGAEERGGQRMPRAWILTTNGAWAKIGVESLAGRTGTGMDLLTWTAAGWAGMNAATGDAWFSDLGLGWLPQPAFEAELGDTALALASTEKIIVAGGRSAAGRPVFWRTSILSQFPL